MQRIIKRYFWIALLAVGLQKSPGFALLGPLASAPSGGEAWQTTTIGYDLPYTDYIQPGGPVYEGDIGGPHNIGEEYRRDVPKMYYTYDQTFLNFFGADGVTAVDGAYGIMNGLPSADQTDLSQYPLEAIQPNFTAQSLYLTDIKSVTLHLLVEQLGLADPERFVWTLHGRVVPPGCPLTTEYLVVSRNFDYQTSPVTQTQYSAYVNDVFFTYFIEEFCTGPAPLAYTVPFSTDPEAMLFTTVAANNFDGNGLLIDNDLLPHNLSGGLQVGYFYTGLTRDDMAGLKYLFTTNNVNWETPNPGSLLFSVTINTNIQLQFPATAIANNGLGYYSYNGTYGYGDYAALVAAAVTNSPAQLQALYPGLVIANSYNYFVLATNYTYTQYFTNSGFGQPYPPPLILVTVTNKNTFFQEEYVTTFGNVFPYNVRPTTTYQLQTTTISPNFGAPYPAPPVTNTVTRNVTKNTPSGGFFALPMFHTNVCPFDIIKISPAYVAAVTNFLAGAATNVVTTTNTSSFTSTMVQINYFTNYVFILDTVNCAEVAGAANLYQGIGGTKFVREDYDSLLGQFFQPVTNYYTMVELTNSMWVSQRFLRVVTAPDILMDAADGGAGLFNGTVLRNINFTPSPRLNGLAGPGTIDTPSLFTYNKIGDSSWNGYDLNTFLLGGTNSFLSQLGAIPSLAWASFDGTTNPPEVYPNGTSIATLEAILAVNFTPATPPDGYVGVSYSQTFAVGDGLLQPPLNWSASGLPPGMSVTSAGNGTDFILSGTPSSAGVYDFILYVSDGSGHSVQWTRTITIH